MQIQLWREILEPYTLAVEELKVKLHPETLRQNTVKFHDAPPFILLIQCHDDTLAARRPPNIIVLILRRPHMADTAISKRLVAVKQDAAIPNIAP